MCRACSWAWTAAGYSARAEVTDRMLIAGPWHLRAVLDEPGVHCNGHRRHRARNLRPRDDDGSFRAPVGDLAATAARARSSAG
jgi:hypothetical protein